VTLLPSRNQPRGTALLERAEARSGSSSSALGTRCPEGELIERCRATLTSFTVPSYIEFNDELPRTPVGKFQNGLLGSANLSTEQGAAS
jgi:acyl-coenzyme A synthetase/AMP-(fatty) acid ligase